MKPDVRPPRLLDSPEFGALLKSAARRQLNPARLARNGLAIQGQVAALSAAGSASSVTGAGLKAATVTKIILPVVVVAAGVTVLLRNETPPSPPMSVSPAQPLPGVEATPRPVVEPPAPESLPAATHRERPRADTRATNPTPPKPTSELPDQLQLFERARAAAAIGDYERALSLLDELERRHPQGPLRVEVLLSRADTLSRAGRDAEAEAFIQSILDRPELFGKKAELLRLLADHWMRRGACARAVPAYQQALGLGLEGEDADAARAGLKKCRGP